jgi:hypothetical protein
MDIEGGEYTWIESLSSDDLKKFKQIAIEMHFINNDGLDIKYELKKKCLKKLFETHYIIHIHANNGCGTINNIPNVVEITYLRKDIIGDNIIYNKSPLPDSLLDYPNVENKPEINLNFFPFVS